MGAKTKLSRDQKRKAKLRERAQRRPDNAPMPYEGEKYRSNEWAPYVYATELAVYETIIAANERLTNDQAKKAFVLLIGHLRNGSPGPMGEEETDLEYAVGQEVEFLFWNIRRHWAEVFQQCGPVASSDLTGILRTLLYSIEAHEWNTGRARGYVHFIKGFIERGGM